MLNEGLNIVSILLCLYWGRFISHLQTSFYEYCVNLHEILLTALQIVVFNSPDKVTELAGYKEMYNYLCEAGDLVPSVECQSG